MYFTFSGRRDPLSMRTPSCVVGLLARKSYFEWCYGSRGRPEISVVVCVCVVGATVFPPAFSSSLHPTLYLSDERGHLICVSSIELCAGEENSPLTSQSHYTEGLSQYIVWGENDAFIHCERGLFNLAIPNEKIWLFCCIIRIAHSVLTLMLSIFIPVEWNVVL